MENKFFTPQSSLIRGIVALVIGLLAIFLPKLTLQTIIIVMGIMLLIGAILFIILAIRSDIKKEKNVLLIQSAINLALGLLFVFFPGPIVSIFVILLGIMLLILGVFSLINLYSFRKIARIPFFALAISVLVIIAGIVLLFNPFETAQAILIFLGIVLIVYAIGEFYSAWMLKKNTSKE
ncbi:MAG TPA: DUF308 domain-containing protein [Bacteroidales bacterium]|nr:DUF308 domain-containing protein [Bacteroidales bacterium]HOS20867.1 DUF308 domain-containing protein [Bacteroidales bacterium]HOU82603.1 DUF308 domain-containing protein [Bacteroidales bacterium]HPL03412.1 DUF308 domain-containing protein [Bacteroidales bacterium]HQJ58313.1 DUF308 domain-containing protein [Bacteroidales bacterium]